jgi:hypothetical protein
MLLQEANLKNVDLIGVTLDELGGEFPVAGTEVCLRGLRYRVVNVKPPKPRSPRRWSRSGHEDQPQWKLLVERVPADLPDAEDTPATPARPPDAHS